MTEEFNLNFSLLGTGLRSGGFSVQALVWTKHGRCSGWGGVEPEHLQCTAVVPMSKEPIPQWSHRNPDMLVTHSGVGNSFAHMQLE